MVLAPPGLFSQRVSQTRARFSLPSEIVRAEERPSRASATLGATRPNGSSSLKTRRRHSACGAVQHPRQVKPGQQIDASPCQLPGIRSEPRPTEGSSRIRSVCTKSARSPAQPARPGQLVQAHNCASASAPLSAPHDSTLPVVFRPRLITSMRGRSSSDQRLRQGRFFWRRHRPTRATNKDWRLPDAIQRPSAKTKRWSADTKTNNQTLQCCSREPRRNRNHGSLVARPPTADRPAETTLDAELRKLATFSRFESAAAIFRLNAIFGTRAGQREALR